MTATIGSAVAAMVIGRITGPAGVNSSLAALTQTDQNLAGLLNPAQVRSQNVSADLAERGSMVKYPAVNVYCEQIVNQLTEKFRMFSGAVQMAIEVWHSQDRLEGLQDSLDLYADAVMDMLNASRGDWGQGAFYGGAYKVAFGAVKSGGKNFIQIAKITFEIGVSKS
jgi:hypothetical protein